MCYLDNEFEAVLPIIQNRKDGFSIEICSAEDHVSEIERCIRTIKERDCGIGTTLPFARIPQILLIHSVFFCIL